jgi:hypothetical protein
MFYLHGPAHDRQPVRGGMAPSQRDLSFSLLEDIAAIDHQDGSIHVACAV